MTDTLDLTSTVTLPGTAFPIVIPETTSGISLNLWQGMTALQQEALVVDHRLPMAQAFVRANGMDKLVRGEAGARLVIVSAGKAWLDVMQALDDLGLDEARCRAIGISVVKLALVWPLDPVFARQACLGAREVLVVEEKRPVIEDQLTSAFYGNRRAPAITGKTDGMASSLLPLAGVLDPATVRRALVRRLAAHGLLDDMTCARDAELSALEESARMLSLTAIRPAYFCSGCPHNTSTVVPAGSQAMGATGCHGLAHYMPERRTMQTVGMGGEGMPWVAAQGYVDTPHMFQNLGDGTYTHSGILSIRAAVAAKSRVTFKILYNDAVAMTGGQPAEGALTPEQIVRELVVEGVHPVVLVSEDPRRFSKSDLPAGLQVVHRDELDRIQRELREVMGTSAIVYEQTCANEKRRRRKRGALAEPKMRLFINPAVCEGCGDCSVQSNCLSIEPIETEFGRKRAIDQSSCNKDYSCLKGFCPSFVAVTGGVLARGVFDRDALARQLSSLPVPAITGLGGEGFAMLVTGIGGTGVLTVGSLLAMAAHMEGKAAKVLDLTGMAQKGGAVTSHVRLAKSVEDIPSSRLRAGQADLVIGCDLIVTSAPDTLALARPDTRVLANSNVQPTGEFQRNKAMDLSAERFLSAIARRVPRDRIAAIDAGSLAERLLGDSIYTNLIMIGFAAQQGLLPVKVDSIAEAIRLNGIKVQDNLDAFAIGRLAAFDPLTLSLLTGEALAKPSEPTTLSSMIESRVKHLTLYQNQQFAAQYRTFIEELISALSLRSIATAETFLIEVARQLARLMAYKDEYEVARLYSSTDFRAGLADRLSGRLRLKVWLSPPILPLGYDAKSGRPRKIALGGWVFMLFRFLTAIKWIRGTHLDPFGHTTERRIERALAGEYREMLRSIAGRITSDNLPIAIRIASAPEAIVGFGPVKEAGISRWRDECARLLAEFETSGHDNAQST